MAVAAPSRLRVSVDGKFFSLGGQKFYVKGVAYGPFCPNGAGRAFATPEQTAGDFARIRELGANVVRVYEVPDKWVLDLAQSAGLKLLIDIPWNQHVCFLDSPEQREGALKAVRNAVSACAGHPAVFAFSVANEIPPDVVRWSGTCAIADFIDELALAAKRADPECLCTFTNFPSTEFVTPTAVDFACFNVYLHQKPAFKAYLARLQMLADAKPLVLGEFGFDSIREGEARKAAMLRWQIEDAFRAGLAGCVVFSFTDDWYRDGCTVTDWQMGLTTRDRQPKESFAAVREAFGIVPRLPLPRYPKVSVVVASYNGDRTLKACLESLRRLNYPDYEVILVDDGSTDSTPQIVAAFPDVRAFRHPRNLGLSIARNTGISAATGEIVAFTDADCRVDEDWLYYLVGDLLNSDFAGIGGPNLLPRDDSAVAAAVMASPGGPAHVMLTDRQAEHIPGCNMAFYKWALEDVGGFDPIFVKAGDDVDICWRLQQAGCKIGFSPSALVWHYRRSTVGEYLKQQRGYGEAEALLVRKHPEYFNSLGGSIWRGRIYARSSLGVVLRRSVIYRGLFGSAGYQAMYASQPALSLMLCTTLEYHVLVTLPLWVLSATFHALFPLAITSLLLSIFVCTGAALQASLSRQKARWWSRPLVGLMYLLQPIVRGWARYRTRLAPLRWNLGTRQNLDSVALAYSRRGLGQVDYWTERRIDRLRFLQDILKRLDDQGWPNRADVGWSDYDLEISDGRWCKLQVTTVSEQHPGGKQMIRVRLCGRWSMRATVAFWVMSGAELLILGLARFTHPWLALLLLALPAFVFFLHREKRNLQSIFRVFLDDVAKEWQLTRVPHPAERERTAKPPKIDMSESPFRAPVETQAETRT